MSYSPKTYRALIEQVGEGALADHLLDKWLSDDETGLAKFVVLADDIYKFGMPPQHVVNKVLGEQAQPQIRRWRVVLWYYSMGYSRKQVATQLGCGIETVKKHLKYAQKDLGVVSGNVNFLVALAIRRGLIP